MKTESLGGFDRFRVPAALLVIAIHTGPLLSLNGEANYLLTDILARIAVPFFFSVSGWFLVPRLLREGRAALIPFVKKLLLLYGAAVLLYLPLNLYNHTLEESGFALLRDVPGCWGTAISASPPPCRPSGPGTRPCSSSSTTHATACSSPLSFCCWGAGWP